MNKVYRMYPTVDSKTGGVCGFSLWIENDIEEKSFLVMDVKFPLWWEKSDDISYLHNVKADYKAEVCGAWNWLDTDEQGVAS